ncbi:MAG: hypothetical protein ACRYFX_19920 [Janthinobacterium lividum]
MSKDTKAALTKKEAAGIKLGAPTKSAEVVDQMQWPKAGEASNQAIARALKMSLSTVVKCMAY